MADPTILDYAEQRSEAAKKAVTDAQLHLAKAQAAITAKRDQLATATGSFANLEKIAAEIRKRLGVIPTPVDGPKLLHDLEQAIIGSRAKQAAILKAGSDLRAAQSDADQAQAELAAASASRGKAESDLLQAGKSDSLRKGWKTALAAPPLVTIDAAAGDALNDKPFTEAEARVGADLPPILRTRATERRTAEGRRIAKTLESAQAAEDYLLGAREQTGAGGRVESTRGILQRAEAAAKDFVNNAKSRFDEAKTLLTQVADKSRFPLTPEQRAALTDTTLEKEREDAVAAEVELGGLKNGVEVAQAKLDQAMLDAIFSDTPANRAAVAQAEIDLAAAQGNLDTAVTSYNPSVLDAWEAAAPDSTWRLLDDFEKAKALLTELRDSDPLSLAKILGDAEERYVQALLAADASVAQLTQLAAEHARRAARRQSALQAESNSLFSALRGDY